MREGWPVQEEDLSVDVGEAVDTASHPAQMHGVVLAVVMVLDLLLHQIHRQSHP